MSSTSTPTGGDRTPVGGATSPRDMGGSLPLTTRSLKGSLKPGSKRTHSGELVGGSLKAQSPVGSPADVPFDHLTLICSIFRIGLAVSCWPWLRFETLQNMN